ncbi:mannitol-1-phosphate 5-dehydrogenase [Dothidotthia symphoricarpi CBS 119687]|uniref:Mannitol-1-phosphate 5-dehydrogenase n=1 Tax=Dothidotthia symphoricarpi CBS 119687 TaxID=1392245 RepID=A0A6A6A1P6_9PLEO|nr:mannitol-1-phosphate 5-dehydrogenase [Dothidotthia symphoricarpi CBS 119687]KAF2125084.1 mannitol-1-phosphate 5-dehydrogenase [Dothidotthia symphoricarpi CBS 119687]
MSYEKKAVHFGGGNIGRGFVAEFLHNSGYEVVFVDVMDSIIEQLQKTPSYTVTEIGEDGERTFTIDHYRAINSKHEMDKVVKEIASADVVTCAVGPNILKFVAEPVAKAIEARTLDYPIAVIACENAINATTTWRGFIEGKLSEDTKSSIDKKARFANSAIDRIVPQQEANAGLNVKIEKFFEWCVEQKPFDNGGKKPAIEGVHYVDDLEPYIERKLFTVNTSHATAAYYGHQKKIPYIHEVLQNKELHDIVRDAVKETAHLIVNKHGISAKEQDDYVDSIVARISNPELKDNVERVGRAPLRKLSRKERFVGPAAQLAERGEKFDALLGSIEMAYRFQNVEGDDESFELAKILKENSAEEVVTKVNGLEKDHPLFKSIVPIVQKVQTSASL